MQRIGVGLYGAYGHQVHGLLEGHPKARLAAVACFEQADHPVPLKNSEPFRSYGTLEELLADPAVELVSLCSPMRRDQAADAIRCLRAGKHVYAEKPCTLSKAELDAVLAVARETGRQFREMAGTAFGHPYDAMRQIVASGVLGPIIQVFAQKSYRKAFGRRPQDEERDGGLIMQCGVHAFRMLEHVALQQIVGVDAVETTLGNPVAGGGLRMAASCMVRFANGGVGSVVANYLNPAGNPQSSHEQLRIFGERGFIEAVDNGTRTRLVLEERDLGPLDLTAPTRDYFDYYIDCLRGEGAMPLSLEDELSPTRWVMRAKAAADRRTA